MGVQCYNFFLNVKHDLHNMKTFNDTKHTKSIAIKFYLNLNFLVLLDINGSER